MMTTTLLDQLAEALRDAQSALDSCAKPGSLQARALENVDDALIAYDAQKAQPQEPAGEYTAGPWKDNGSSSIGPDPDEVHHGWVCRINMQLPQWRDNRRRIMACVNACAGVPTEALQVGHFVKLDDDPLYELVEG